MEPTGAFSVDSTHYSANGRYYQAPATSTETTGFFPSAVQYKTNTSYYQQFNPSSGSGFTADALVCKADGGYYLPFSETQGDPSAPSIPLQGVTPTTTRIVMYFNGGFVGGTPPVTFSFLYGTTPDPTTPFPASDVPGLTIYTGQFNGLTPGTTYYFKSVATNAFGVAVSEVSSATTASVTPTPPAVPGVPTFVSATPTTITVTNTAEAPVVGTQYGVSLQSVFFPGVNTAGVVVTTVTGLAASTAYTFRGVASNAAGVAQSALSAPFSTTAPVALTTNIVTTFLIQGPLFNTPYSTALNYYVNCDAVGTAGGGTQTFGSWYAKTSGTIPPAFPFAPDWKGLVLTDNTTADNSQRSTDYLSPLQAQGAKLIVSFGGYYADALGLFGPYQPAGYPGTNPSSAQVIESFCNIFLAGTSATNPLGWSNSGWKGQKFDGLNLDFENIGYGGIPSSNQYPLGQSPEPIFPAANSTNIPGSAVPYSAYINALGDIPSVFHGFAPTKILNHAPLSASINAEVLLNQNGRNVAVTTALNTWFAFPDFSAPTTTNYNSAPSKALNHPSQMQYYDDVFVQFYNESPNNYLGGINFPYLLAQWGYVCLVAQRLGTKTPKVNIGLAKGPASTAPLTPPYFYPMYSTASPPNPSATAPAGNTYPNIGVNPIDSGNLVSAINRANTLLQASGLPGAVSFIPSDWCSGAGFWAGGPATIACKTIFQEVPNLPRQQVYTWSDAQYPAPDTLWAGNVPF
jgi:hypothetical protein